jgi:hypothetical protein
MSFSWRVVRAFVVTGLGISALGASLQAEPGWAATSAQGPPGHLVLVQAVPHEALDVTIDGKSVGHDSAVGSVLGPFSETAGRHRVELTNASGDVRLVSTVDVAPGSSSDVVVHLPAQVGGSPVVNSYRTPRAPIAPGKARVLIAHTATVAPADVRVDGAVVFHDIANGEYATADIAAGAHTVALLPAGLDASPILGPLDLSLAPGTVTMVYAVGNPRTHSMNVIVHRASLASNGAVAPGSIDTGSAGLAAGTIVRPFGTTPPAVSDRQTERSVRTLGWVVGASLLVAGGAVVAARPRRGATHRRR